MSERTTIIDKIKKLLRMKRGGTPDEIATALRLAQELAAKHGIDLGAVNPDEEQVKQQPITQDDELLGRRVSWESKYASLICSNFFNVSVFLSTNSNCSKYVYTFVGEEWDIQTAIYVYRFLCGHFRREWKARKGLCKKRQVFLYWMMVGLAQKLQERQPNTEQTPGIVTTDRQLQRRTEYIKLRWKLNTTSVKPNGDSIEAMNRGWRAGMDTEIHSGVTGNESKGALIVDASRQLEMAR